jgi:hypothetical protein
MTMLTVIVRTSQAFIIAALSDTVLYTKIAPIRDHRVDVASLSNPIKMGLGFR